jgi:cell shape-determining protein MreC
MDGKRKNFVAPLALAVVLFLTGIVLGFYIWGVDRGEQMDYKQVLRDTINYIATIEHRNENFRERVAALETELAVAREQGEESAEQLTGETESLKQQIQNLRNENRELRSNLQSLTQQQDTGGVGPAPQQDRPGG